MGSIAPAKDIHPNTFVGGFQFNNGRSYRLFYQSKDGAIHAMLTDDFGANWSGGDSRVMAPAGKAMINTPLVSCIFTDKVGTNSRTFYIGADYKIRVVSVTAGAVGDNPVANGSFQTAPYSRLGGISWTNGGVAHIRLYYQAPNDSIQEICWDGSGDFVKGHTFPVPMRGTALTFINRNPNDKDPSIRGYYQHLDFRIMEICWDAGSGWNAGTLINGNNPLMNQAHISCCCSSTGQMNVYWQTDGNGITECVWNSGWSTPKKIVVSTASSNSRFQATCHVPQGGNQTQVRLFFVGQNGLINDARCENNQWGWAGQQGCDIKWTPCI